MGRNILAGPSCLAVYRKQCKRNFIGWHWIVQAKMFGLAVIKQDHTQQNIPVMNRTTLHNVSGFDAYVQGQDAAAAKHGVVKMCECFHLRHLRNVENCTRTV